MLQSTPRQILLQMCLLAICLKAAMACRGILLAAGITDEEREIILKEHNRLRQTVATGLYPGQPAAENMREIVWDEELAQRAQKWAENCDFSHDPFRKINRFTMGQNLAIIWSNAPLDPDDGDFPSRIKSWFNEVQQYSFGDAWSQSTGHYSQLVWGETSLVGCGYAEYKAGSKYNKLYVCNYGPGGNVVGYNPYEVGKPSCALYGMVSSSRYHGLCSPPEGFTNNAIETYDFNNINKKVTNSFDRYRAYNQHESQFTTQYKYNNHKTSINNNENTLYKEYEQYQQKSTSFNHHKTQQQELSATAEKLSLHPGYVFGSQSLTTESSQKLRSQFRSHLDTYKPSSKEFKKSIYKHTVLRPSVAKEQHSKPVQGKDNAYSTTVAPVKRGWSLLTWRG